MYVHSVLLLNLSCRDISFCLFVSVPPDIDVQLVGLVKMIIDPELMITVEGEHIAVS